MKRENFIVKTVLLLGMILALFLGLTLGCSENKKQTTTYQITATLDEKNMKVNAQMQVNYFNDSESRLDEIKFHLYPNAYKMGSFPVPSDQLALTFQNGINEGGIEISSVKVAGAEVACEGAEKQILSVPAFVEPLGKIKIDINFVLQIPNCTHRLGFWEENVNLGNWFPIVCIYKNGQWDEHTYSVFGDPFYSECADYSVNFTFPDGYEFAATGNAKVRGNTAKVTAKNVRDFAVCLTKNKEYSTTESGIKIKYYGADGENKFLDTAVQAVNTFSKLFGKYPYDFLSVVKTSFFTGGMEYPGLIYVSDSLSESLTHEVIVHEIAHQWWYGAVGNDQVNEAWLDEGLTEFSTTLFYQHNPDYGVTRSSRVADAMTSYMLYRESHLAGGDKRIARNLSEFRSNLEYTYMTYVKGGLMFESVCNLMGDDSFIKGLKSYYKAHKFSLATADDFIGCMENASKKSLKGIFSAWLEGEVKMY